MPNHCCNTLIMCEITLPIILKNYIGKDEKGDDVFDFERIAPVGDVPDWYERRLEKWGTKWFGYDLSIGDTEISFYTAWSPPLPIIKKLAELHKELVFRLEYYETGAAFRGIYIAKWKDGKVHVEDKSWNMADEDFEELGFL